MIDDRNGRTYMGSIFAAYWSPGYRGLQGVTGGYKRVARGYMELMTVTRGFGGLQGVIEEYKGLQEVTWG